MHIRPAALIGVIASLLGAPALAQPIPADSDRSTVVDEVTVVSRPVGPAIWKAERGQGQVIILGSITPVPHRPPWDTRRFEALLNGAHEVLLPPLGTVSPVDALRIAASASRLRLPRGATLPDVLPPDLDQAYADAVWAYRLDARKYEEWKPAAAGFLMLSAVRETAGFSSAKPGSTVLRFAKAKNIPVRYIGDGSLIALFNAAKTLDDRQQITCFRLAIGEMRREWDTGRITAGAWARGDLETVRANYSAPTLETCLLQMPNYRTLIDRGVAEAAAELDKALNRPGKTVAVIDLNLLLRRGGLLDQLKARGATISEPLPPISNEPIDLTVDQD